MTDHNLNKQKDLRKRCIGLCILTIVLVVLCLVEGTVITWLLIERGSFVYTPRGCRPCAGEKKPEAESQNNFIKVVAVGDNAELCCPLNPIIPNEVSLQARRIAPAEKWGTCRPEHLLLANITKEPHKPYAHCVGVYPKRHGFIRKDEYTLSWDDKRNGGFSHHVHYEDGKLCIKKSGLYYIYSQIVYRNDLSLSRRAELYPNGGPETLVHSVGRSRVLSPEQTIMLKSESCDQNWWDRTSYLGTLTYLRARDCVYVNSSSIEYMTLSTYFGLYMI